MSRSWPTSPGPIGIATIATRYGSSATAGAILNTVSPRPRGPRPPSARTSPSATVRPAVEAAGVHQADPRLHVPWPCARPGRRAAGRRGRRAARRPCAAAPRQDSAVVSTPLGRAAEPVTAARPPSSVARRRAACGGVVRRGRSGWPAAGVEGGAAGLPGPPLLGLGDAKRGGYGVGGGRVARVAPPAPMARAGAWRRGGGDGSPLRSQVASKFSGRSRHRSAGASRPRR